MRIRKAVITAASPRQRTLPLQTLIDSDGVEKSVLRIILEEIVDAGIEEVCLIVCPGDESAYTQVAGDHAGRLHFVVQEQPRGYADAVYLARGFVGDVPFAHLVGDHLYVSRTQVSCARQLIQIAVDHDCAVSSVQSTREGQLPYFGAIGGQRFQEQERVYRIDQVREKPTPTEAERELMIPGLRAGHYLCLFGIHVLTPTIFAVLDEQRRVHGSPLDTGDGDGAADTGPPTFSVALTALAGREQYLALEMQGWRYDVGVKYGLLTAQLALALSGVERDEVLAQLVELLALRHTASTLGTNLTEEDSAPAEPSPWMVP